MSTNTRETYSTLDDAITSAIHKNEEEKVQKIVRYLILFLFIDGGTKHCVFNNIKEIDI